MKQFPLQLKQSVVRDVACKAAETSEFCGTISLSTTPSFARSEDDSKLWQISLIVQFKAGEGETKPLQYTGRIDVMGLFVIDESVPEETALKMIAINGPTMLYGMARETIAFITSRSVHGVYLLPTITFADLSLAVKEASGKIKPPARSTTPAPARTR